MNNIGQIILEGRKRKGLSQEELAEKANVNLRTIQRIEKDKNEPRGRTLNLICEVLEIESQSLIQSEKKSLIVQKVVNLFFLLILNLALMSIIGFLTLDSNANLNSRFGALLLGVFIPLSIVYLTSKMKSTERMLKFGTGFIVYPLLSLIFQGLPLSLTTGLIPSSLVFISILYFGNEISRAGKSLSDSPQTPQ
ncbi:helix-turn-helix transcriptional regulator [Marivirga sp.]|uniref:helix-turn-helix domain-containing protein n=1 Tax=Marivirga sp. TaxID=2018662 RepID=UPI0025D7EFAF|nr:helix-turn-helix transcriptional regulator [Marivirga sp.]